MESGQKDVQTGKWADRQTDWRVGRQTYRLTSDRQTYRLASEQTVIQTVSVIQYAKALK